MEIILPQFNIDEAINSHWQSNITKSEMIDRDRESALETAIKSLTSQFQRELDTYLEGNIQTSLRRAIVPPQTLDIFAVYAVLIYKDIDFVVRRNAQNWEIAFNHKAVIATSPDLLQKTILLELGNLKNELSSRTE